MPKVVISPELADAVRALRKSSGITAKDLSLAIGKSSSYITVFEKNNIKTMDLDDFELILKSIVGDDPSSLEHAYTSLQTYIKLRFSNEEGSDQVIFYNFDTIRRQVPVPHSLVDYLLSEIHENDIDIDYLLEVINSNLDLSVEELKRANLSNQWELIDGSLLIVLNISKEYLEALFTYKIKSSNYQFLLAVVYYIERIKVGDFKRRPNQNLKEKSENILREHKVYSLNYKLQVEKPSTNAFTVFDELSNEDNHNRELINNIATKLKQISDLDVIEANKRLETILDNLKTDLGFSFSFISLDLSRISDMSINNKKELFQKIKKLIEEFEPYESSIDLY